MNRPDQISQDCSDTLLTATAAGNYEQFISVGDEKFKDGIKPEMFHRVSQTLSPRMRQGFTSTFLGDLRQNGSTVSLWQLRFSDRGDDRLMRVSMAYGKVTGALITPPFS